MLERILALSPNIRYVALYRNKRLDSRQREGVTGASTSESDRYEELLVNPTVLTLVRQRGDIDCGGAEFVVVRYGQFYQLLLSLPDGHASICIELCANPIDLVDSVRSECLGTD